MDKATNKYFKADKKDDKATAKSDKAHAKVAAKEGEEEFERVVGGKATTKRGRKALKAWDSAKKASDKRDSSWKNVRQKQERAGGMSAVRQSAYRTGNKDDKYVLTGNKHKDHNKRDPDAKTDLERQAEVNRKRKATEKSLKTSLNRAGLEKAAAAKPKRERVKMKAQDRKGIIKKPKVRSESAFTDFIDELKAPLYEKEGDIPKCPPGYRWDKETVMCVPKSKKDAVSDGYSSKELKPGNNPGYNVWGASGYNGDGYAFEEPPTQS